VKRRSRLDDDQPFHGYGAVIMHALELAENEVAELKESLTFSEKQRERLVERLKLLTKAKASTSRRSKRQ